MQKNRSIVAMFFVAMILAVFMALPAIAAEQGPAGWVQKASGEAYVIRDGGIKDKAAYDVPVMLADSVSTGAGATLQIMFRDETIIALGENSLVAVVDVFTPNGEGSFSMQLLKGTARMVSGKIARENSDKFEIRTPLGSIGIRGTDFGFLSDPGKDVVMLFAGGPVIYTDMQNPSFRVGLCERIRNAKADLNRVYGLVSGPDVLTVRRNMIKINKLDKAYGCSPSN